MNIVVSGKGIVCAIGNNVKEVQESLRNNRCGIETVRYLRTIHTELPVGEVKMSNEDMKRHLGIAIQQEVGRTPLMGAMAIREALSDAQISLNDNVRKVVLISGTTVGGMDITEEHYADLKTGKASGEILRHHGCGQSTRQMSELAGPFSEMTTISTACSSAANAIMLGSEMLKSREADIVIAGGAEALSRFHLNGFNSLMILDNKPCRPFDNSRSGLNLGEGAAYVVIEREEDVIARCARVQAYITGYSNTCDAFHQTASSDNGEGAYLAMSEALRSANIQPEQIDYLNAHGTATSNNDITESVAIKRVFGEHIPPVSSTKGHTGHTTSASGSVEAVICLLAMENNLIPANLRYHQQTEGGVIPVIQTQEKQLYHVMSNSFGFGGNDTCLIFSKHATNTESTHYIYSKNDIEEASNEEITQEEELSAIREYVKPIEARRMGRIQKAFTITSQRAIAKAGIEKPDAIISATNYGFIDFSAQLLEQIEENDETGVSPSLFMQSTHNTASSAIAIRTQCHGYNSTYSQSTESLDWALRDAYRLLRTGKCRSVLVGLYDEHSPLFESLPKQDKHDIHAQSIILKIKEK